MTGGYDTGLLSRLAKRDFVTPYIERAFFDDVWNGPSYTIEIETRAHGAGTDGYFHPSTHSESTDDRWLYYQIHPELSKLNLPEKPTLGLSLAAAVGTSMHAVIQQKMKSQGLVTDEEIEIKALDEAHHWKGSLDLMFQGRLIDIKTCTSGAFDYTNTLRSYWKTQLEPYMDYMGLKKCIVLLVEVGYPYRMKEIPYESNPELLKAIYDRWERVYNMVHNGEPPPPHCCSLNSQKMKECPSRAHCWEGLK